MQVSRLKQFKIFVKNRPGILASVCDTLARGAVNLKAIATDGHGNEDGVIRIVTDDERSTRDILTRDNYRFADSDILIVQLKDQPGEMARLTKTLAAQRININDVYVLGSAGGHTRFSMSVDDLMSARKALKDYQIL